MAPKRYQIYPSPALDRVLNARIKPGAEAEGFRSRSSMISAIADRYDEAVRRHMPDLSTAEWCLIFDVMNGCWIAEDAAMSANGIAHNIADGTTLDAAGEKWDVDGLELARKVDALPFASKIAILDTAERFWSMGCFEGESYEALVARLTGKPTANNDFKGEGTC